MPNLAASFTIDSSSSTGRCNYPLTALGGTPVPTTIVAGAAPLTIIAGNPYVCTPVPGAAGDPLPCAPGVRTIKAKVNTTVLINGQFPVVSGDVAQLLGTQRPLTGPYQQLRIVIGSNLN